MNVFLILKQYADQIIDQLDPKKKLISHRLYRNNCTILNNNSYFKDLSLIHRNLKDVIIIDVKYPFFPLRQFVQQVNITIVVLIDYIFDLKNLAKCFKLHQENGILIDSFFDNLSDTELFKLLPFLKFLHNLNDVRDIRRQADLFFQQPEQSRNTRTLHILQPNCEQQQPRANKSDYSKYTKKQYLPQIQYIQFQSPQRTSPIHQPYQNLKQMKGHPEMLFTNLNELNFQQNTHINKINSSTSDFNFSSKYDSQQKEKLQKEQYDSLLQEWKIGNMSYHLSPPIRSSNQIKKIDVKIMEKNSCDKKSNSSGFSEYCSSVKDSPEDKIEMVSNKIIQDSEQQQKQEKSGLKKGIQAKSIKDCSNLNISELINYKIQHNY